MPAIESVDNAFQSISPAANAEVNKTNDELDQADFIKLLVTQIKNQDPTKPMDPAQFMSQLTQSSMVNGLNDMQVSFDTLASKLTSDQSLQAANLVGRTVLLEGGDGTLDAGGSISGQVDFDGSASDVSIKIYNYAGEQIKTLPLGGNSNGQLQFKWNGFADDGSAARAGSYYVTAEALVNGEQQAVPVSLESKIDSVNINSNGSGTGTLLNLASGQSVSLDDILKIK